jgi:hypothetical protein
MVVIREQIDFSLFGCTSSQRLGVTEYKQIDHTSSNKMMRMMSSQNRHGCDRLQHESCRLDCSSACGSTTMILRHVIAINNTGVSLLEKHCYQQAQETFQDAMTLIHHIVHITQQLETTSLSVCDISCFELQQQASQRLLNNLHTYHPTTTTAVQMQAIELLDDDDDVIVDSILHIHCYQINDRCCTTFHPIRYEYHNPNHDTYCDTPEFEAAIILHNLGLVYFVMSSLPFFRNYIITDAPKNDTRMQYRQQALQCFRKSYMIYAKIISKQQQRQMDANIVTTTTTRCNQYRMCCLDLPIYYRGMIVLLHTILQALWIQSFGYDNSSSDTDNDDGQTYQNEVNYYRSMLQYCYQCHVETTLWKKHLGLQSITASAA